MPERMQLLDAIVAAGPGVALVARPGGVTHLYRGPLTQTGMVPAKRRPVCRAHTRRLYDRSSFPVRGDIRVCARCSARLTPRTVPAVGPVEHPSLPAARSMADDRARYAALDPVDLYLSIRFAVHEHELDECSLALQLGFTPAQQVAEYTSPTGRTFCDLPRIVEAQRARIRPNSRRLFQPQSMKGDPAYWDAVRKVDAARPQPHRRTA